MNDNLKSSADSGFLDSSQSRDTPQLTKCSRKRKAPYVERNLSETMDCYSPQFSSTLNESLVNHLEKINLENEQYQGKVSTINTIKQNKKFCSVPNTPEHQVKYARDVTKKASTNSFIKNFSQIGMQNQSPLNKEAYNILYPELPSLELVRKPGTPLKIEKGDSQAKKRLFYPLRQSSLQQILSNSIIMNKILRQLSNGDLYRLAKVSNRFKDAILNDFESAKRFSDYTQFFRQHKENYKITPPNSPEKDDELNVEGSPASKNFLYFCQIARDLNKNQSLIKCPSCQKASIVENNIAQCQNIGCGYIFCKKCESFSLNPKDFKDKCNNAQLLNNTKSRNLFGDLSNSTITSDYVTGDSSFLFSSSLNLNSSSKYENSAVFSESKVSTPKQNVKRNLSRTFMSSSEIKMLSSNNRISTPQAKKQTRRTTILPVIPVEPKQTPISDLIQSPSPLKIKQYSAGSKQSKKSLKRLTQ